MATLRLLRYNNKRCDNQLEKDNRYKVSVCVSKPFKIFSTRALCFSEAVNRRQPYHKCKAETHIKCRGLMKATESSKVCRMTRGCDKSILTRILTGHLSVASYATQGDVEDLL
jgi:hypothetical protein